ATDPKGDMVGDRQDGAAGAAPSDKKLGKITSTKVGSIYPTLTGLGTLPLLVVASHGAPSMLFHQGATSAQWMTFLGWAVAMGVAGSWLATWFWAIASRRLPLSLSAQLIAAETVFGLMYGFLFEHRWPSAVEWAGIALQLVGVAVAIALFTSKPADAPASQVTT
ncbi:hypothetical protein AB3X82_23360, partial [Paraburkholderia phenoliruptrix]